MAVKTTTGTAGLFHIDRNGNPAKCEASKETCPLSGDGHYATADEAREKFEDANDPFEDGVPVGAAAAPEIELSVPFKPGVTKFNHCAVVGMITDDGSRISMVMELDQPIAYDEIDLYPADFSDVGGALWEASGGEMSDWNDRDMSDRIEWVSSKLSLYNGVAFHNKNGKFGYETDEGVQKKGLKSEEYRIATFGV